MPADTSITDPPPPRANGHQAVAAAAVPRPAVEPEAQPAPTPATEQAADNAAAIAGAATDGAATPARRRAPRALTLGVPLALICLALGYYFYSQGFESTDDAFIEGHVLQISPRVAGHVLRVNVEDNQRVKAGDVLVELDPATCKLQLDQAEATLAAVEARELAARSSVALTSGTTRAEVDQAASGLDEARSALETAHAQVDSARSLQRQSEAALAAAQATAQEEQANVRAAEAEANQARSDYERYRKLVDDGVIARQQFDQASTARDNAQAKLDSARQKAASTAAEATEARAAVQAAHEDLNRAQTQVDQAQARIGSASGRLRGANTAPHQVAVSQAQLKALAAELAGARAAVEQARLDVQYTKILAPEDGRVTRKSTEVGNYLQVGQSIMALVPERFWVVANFKETQLTHLRPGQPASVEVDAYPGLELAGKVESIQSGTGSRFSLLPAENATGNYVKVVQRVPVKIVLDALPTDGHLLAPGMSVVPRVTVR